MEKKWTCFLSGIKKGLLLLPALLLVTQAFAQQGEITGKVTDRAGTPLVGVVVTLQGTNKAQVTDRDGNFTMSGLTPEAVLVFSYLGMANLEVPTGGRTVLDVMMQEQSADIEMVQVSYSAQRKSSLTASVGVLKGSELVSKPVSNISNSLGGQVSGLITAQSSGEVGSDATEIYIRGISTTGNNSPLIVVDGITRSDITMLDPNNVESISVLKDAAAVAPYGMAGANGVILITTKKGMQSKPTVTYNTYVGFQNPTVIIDRLNSYQYAAMMNDAVLNADPAAAAPYSAEQLAGYKMSVDRAPGADYDKYPNTNAMAETRDKNNLIQSHHVSVAGGTETVNYYMGLGYFAQEGMWSTSNMDKYSLTLNLEAKATKTTTVGLAVNGVYRNIKNPSDNEAWIMHYIAEYKPVDAYFYTNGLLGNSSGKSPYSMKTVGSRKYEATNIYTQLFVEQEFRFLPGLKAKAVFGYDPTTIDQKNWREAPLTYYNIDTSTDPYTYHEVVSPEKPELSQSHTSNKAYTFQGMLTYNKNFGRHSISALAVMEARKTTYSYLGAGRSNYDLLIPELNMGNSNSSNWNNSGYSGKTTQVGYVYRLTYEYDHKYLFETSGRYDGHYYFAPGNRYGFFPSVSVGWRLSEEAFIKDNLPFVSNLKLRGSVGQSGNLAGAAFQYSSAMNVYGSAYAFNGILYQGVSESAEPNRNITWEKATKYNVGLDVGFLRGAVTAEIDFFYEKRNNMLVSPNTIVPIEYGIGISQINAGIMDNRGIDMTLGGRHIFPNGLRLEGIFNFTWAKNKLIETFENPATKDDPNRSRTGRPINTPFGLKAIGLYQQSDFDEYGNLKDGIPKPTFGDVAPGDIRWADVDGNGIIDGNDETALGYPVLPQIIYGFTVRAAWKNFDLSVFLQGAAQSTTFIEGGLAYPFLGGENPPVEALDYWTPTNTNASYPRPFGAGGGNTNNMQNGFNDFFKRSGDYLRIKNIEIGYTLPRKVLNRFNIDMVRVYFSGQNLFTFSNLKGFYDPEMGQGGFNDANSRGWYAPQRKVVSFGVNLSF